MHSLSHIDDPLYLNKTICFAVNPSENESPFKAGATVSAHTS